MIDNLFDIRPTIFVGVPRVWEKMKEKINENLENLKLNHPIKHTISYYAYSLTKRKNIEEMGLDKCKLRMTAAAPIDQKTLSFFESLEIPLTNIYGMSESCGPISIVLPKEKGGQIMPNLNIKITKSKEILIKGPIVTPGYYNNKKANLEGWTGKWFKTGDLGYLDKNRRLHITGRKKELIITKGGENIAPVPIEKEIENNIPECDYAVIIGNNRKYLSAILIPKKGKKLTNIKNKINKINQQAPAQTHTIKKWIVLHNSFSINTGELTDTLKIKRHFIEIKYKKEIESMY